VHEHVSTIEERLECSTIFRKPEIQDHAALAAVQPNEVRAESLNSGIVISGEITAARPLDFDDVRAEIRQVARRQRRGDRVLPGDDVNALQGKDVSGP
jgi:hypothetical protein